MVDPNTDFEDFTTREDASPSHELNQKILETVKNDLSSSHLTVLGKLLSIQGLIGFLTLLLCPQFNFSLTNNVEVFHYFHHNFGESICMIICGAIFIGPGAILAAYLLKYSELKMIKQSRFLYYFCLVSIFLLIFIVMGAEIYLKLTSFWVLGATLSGVILFESNRFIRTVLTRYLIL
ncbi:MAG: hypothetical protein HOJ35_02675 [Bdellovibrionales bacterium]|jgi:hypothetical protein|nr:hypothetical protein [Bdellovibrionales bacterium]